jgi:FMN-binding domain
MKRAPLFVLAGTIAGFAGIMSFHTQPAASTALGGPSRPARTATHPSKPAGAGRHPVPATPGGQRSALGVTENYGYGQLAVKVIVRGHRITDVTVPVIQTAEQYSQQLANQAIPMLRSEVLSGQTARINAVSGATYTSQAYATSLQAALDKLHLK